MSNFISYTAWLSPYVIGIVGEYATYTSDIVNTPTHLFIYAMVLLHCAWPVYGTCFLH